MRIVVLRFALLSLPCVASAQQSLFNAPATLATPKGELFVQMQVNAGHIGELNSTFDLGLGDGFELGLNVFHSHLYGREPIEGNYEVQNAILVNASYTAQLAPSLAWQSGAQGGGGVRRDGVPRWIGNTWTTLKASVLDDHVDLIGGVLLASRGAMGEGFPVNGILGIEWKIVPEVFHFVGDWIAGNSESSVAVLGFAATVAEWQFSAGAQLPSPGSRAAAGAVFEITRTAQ